MSKKSRKARRFRKQVTKKAVPFLRLWRLAVAVVLFILILPTFLATHENDNFLVITLSITAGVIALVFIVERPLNPKLKRYLLIARIFLLIGAILLIATLFMSEPETTFRAGLLTASAAMYAFGAQRLGLGIIVGGI